MNMQTSFRRAHQKRDYMATYANRAARRNAARIVAAFHGNTGAQTVTTESGDVKLYARPYVINGAVVRTANPSDGAKGPFKTTRGANFSLTNPTLSVRECERLSKL